VSRRTVKTPATERSIFNEDLLLYRGEQHGQYRFNYFTAAQWAVLNSADLVCRDQFGVLKSSSFGYRSRGSGTSGCLCPDREGINEV
jgi:hypothetical protein